MLKKLIMQKSAVWPAMLVSALGALGGTLISSTHLFLIEQYVCQDYYALINPEMIGGGGRIDESLCKEPAIQSMVASIQGVLIFLIIAPGLFMAGPWGQLSKILGKKTVLFLNGCSITIQVMFYTMICYSPRYFNIRWIWIGCLFDIIGGGPVIANSLCYTYIADSYDCKDLSRALYRFTALQLICGFLGMSLSSAILRINVYYVCLLSIIFLALTIPTTFFLPSHTLYEPILSSPDTPDTEVTSILPRNPKYSTSKQIAYTLLGHYQHSFELFRDMFASSALSRLTLITFFLLTLTSGIRVIFTQWASINYGWAIADVHILTSFEMVVSGTILLTLPPLSNRFILPRIRSTPHVDILLASASLAFNFLGLLLMAVSPSRLCYVLAISIFTLGAGLMDSLRSFSTSLIKEKDQVEKLYIGMGMTTTLGGMAASSGWNFIFSKAIGKAWFWERGPFWGALVALVAVAVVVRRLSKFAGGFSAI